MPCMVSNLAGYIFAASNFFLWQCRKVLRVLSALARFGSQRRVRTAQCDKSKDLYLACFYDDCSQTFIALGRDRKRITRSFAHWQCACAIGRIDVSHGSSPCRHFSKEGDKGVFVKSSLRHSFHKTTRSRSSHPCVVEMSLGYLFCTTTTFFFFLKWRKLCLFACVHLECAAWRRESIVGLLSDTTTVCTRRKRICCIGTCCQAVVNKIVHKHAIAT